MARFAPLCLILLICGSTTAVERELVRNFLTNANDKGLYLATLATEGHNSWLELEQRRTTSDRLAHMSREFAETTDFRHLNTIAISPTTEVHYISFDASGVRHLLILNIRATDAGWQIWDMGGIPVLSPTPMRNFGMFLPFMTAFAGPMPEQDAHLLALLDLDASGMAALNEHRPVDHPFDAQSVAAMTGAFADKAAELGPWLSSQVVAHCAIGPDIRGYVFELSFQYQHYYCVMTVIGDGPRNLAAIGISGPRSMESVLGR